MKPPSSTPERIVRQGDIAEAVADAVVFSTNEHLFLSGGAGASLLAYHGDPLQKAMDSALAATGAKFASRGSVFEIGPLNAACPRFFAVVAANGFYETKPEDTRSALEEVLERCAATDGVKSVVTTALGTGYGDMEIEDFVEIFCTVRVPPTLRSLELMIHGETFFRAAYEKIRGLGEPARIL